MVFSLEQRQHIIDTAPAPYSDADFSELLHGFTQFLQKEQQFPSSLRTAL
jgi:hypothetical protein